MFDNIFVGSTRTASSIKSQSVYLLVTTSCQLHILGALSSNRRCDALGFAALHYFILLSQGCELANDDHVNKGDGVYN